MSKDVEIAQATLKVAEKLKEDVENRDVSYLELLLTALIPEDISDVALISKLLYAGYSLNNSTTAEVSEAKTVFKDTIICAMDELITQCTEIVKKG